MAMCRRATASASCSTRASVRRRSQRIVPATFTLADGQTLRARCVVDATGDAQIAAEAGVPFAFGRADDRAVMPLTYCFLAGPVDVETVRREIPNGVRHDENTGVDYVYRGRGVLHGPDPRRPKRAASGTSARQRRHLQRPGPRRDRVGQPDAHVFRGRPDRPGSGRPRRRRGPGAGGAVPALFPRLPAGLRAGDFRWRWPGRSACGKAADRGGYEDDGRGRGHVPAVRGRDRPVLLRPGRAQARSCRRGRWTTASPRRPRDIPLRCLVPRAPGRPIVVAGRAISAERAAMSSFRVQPFLHGAGRGAAGVTAALAAQRNDCSVRGVAVSDVQARLRATGGILGVCRNNTCQHRF